MSKTADEKLKKELKALSETIRFSDPMSSPQLSSIENSIDVKISALKDSAGTEVSEAVKLCTEIQELFAERNRKCKLLK